MSKTPESFPSSPADDPHFTAHALGEALSDTERARIEAALASDPALGDEQAELQRLDKALRRAFAAEPAPARRTPSLPLLPGLFWFAGLAAAACLALFLAFAYMAKPLERAPQAMAPMPVDAAPSLPADLPASEPAQPPKVVSLAASEPEEITFDPYVTLEDHSGFVADTTISGTRFRTDNFTTPASLHETTLDFPRARRFAPPTAAGEGYGTLEEVGFVSPLQEPLSTFSLDVDTASYANVRRLLGQGVRPPPGAVRIEEFINYFRYDYRAPESFETPFRVEMEAAPAPWAPEHRLVRVALKGYELPWQDRLGSNLVFLIDVSGSMDTPNKLGLVQRSLRLLVEQLDERDRVAIVTYAGSDRLALPSTTANNRETILQAIDNLNAGGSTHGSAGIVTAYEQAYRHFIKGGANRVILCTDGDFNVGTTDVSELSRLVQEKAKGGVFLSVYGFGMGNYQDERLEGISNDGNGVYGYVDSFDEAKRLFVTGLASNLVTIAKDVKIQVEFNPEQVQAYRLIGYENRALAAEDFNDDRKDAGEMGAGHAMTALYEIIPPGVGWEQPKVDDLKYQTVTPTAPRQTSGEMLTVKLRYKLPEGDTSEKIEVGLSAEALRPLEDTSPDFRWASAVAAFGMLLRESSYSGTASYEEVTRLARSALGPQPAAERLEFLELVEQAAKLAD